MDREDGGWYFAYGSNMSARQMAARCPGATAAGPARLDGHRLAFDLPSRYWGGWVADVVPEAGSVVWGVLWRLRPEHWAALDDYEDVDEQRYRRLTLDVTTADGRPVRAQLYRVVRPRGEGRPSAAYLRTILEGAREHGLPAPYVAWLETLAVEEVTP